MPKQKPKLERAQARARAEAQAPLEREAKHADPALLQFEQWMKLRGVEWDSALHIRACHQKGERPHYAVFAGDSLAVDKPVVTIPKKACLSPLTTGIGELLNEAQLKGGIALIIAVMYERAIVSRSDWYPYFQILSEKENLPMFWDKEDQALLQGTEMQKLLKSDKALMREDWLDIVAPFIAEHSATLPWEAMSYTAFKACASLVSSRAFEIDGEHGMGMVPLADMFNHSTDAEHVHVEGNNSDDDEDEEADDAEKEGGDTLTISMVRAAARGDEVFNTFGKHSNGTLLHRYGFAEWDNDLVTVQIDAATVDIAFGGEAVVAAAAKALKQPWTDDDYTFELDPDGTVDAELLLVLRHACATDAERKEWKAAGPRNALAALHAMGEEAMMAAPDMREALLEVLGARIADYAGDGSADDLSLAKERGGTPGGNCPAGGGCAGAAAALLLRAQEKRVLERAFMLQVTAAKNAASGSKKQKSKPVKKAGDGKRRKLEGTAGVAKTSSDYEMPSWTQRCSALSTFKFLPSA